jgi:hypothetical protein
MVGFAGLGPRGGFPSYGGVTPRGGAVGYGGLAPRGGAMSYGGLAPRGGAMSYGGLAPRGGAMSYGGLAPPGGAFSTGGRIATGGTPVVDGGPLVDAGPSCGPTGENLLLLSTAGYLYSVVVTTLETRLIGYVNCGVSLNSLAVSRAGAAYVSSSTGGLFKIDPTTAACTPTPFPALGSGVAIGFGPGPDPALDILRLAWSGSIGVIELVDYSLRDAVTLTPYRANPAEILGGPDGGVYLFGSDGLSRVDPASGAWQVSVALPADAPRIGYYDFTVLGGSFYLVGGTGGSSTIFRYSLAEASMVTVGSVPIAALGAGTIACGPTLG